MDSLWELVKEAPLYAVFLAVILLLLPCIARIVESLCGLIFNLVLILASLFLRKDIREGKIVLKSDFHGAKFEIGKSFSKDDDESTSNSKGNAKKEPLSIDLNGKTIDVTSLLKRGQ